MTQQQTILFVDIDSTLIENRFSIKAVGEVLQEIAAISGKEAREHGREIGQENDHRQETDPDNVLTMDWQDIIQTIAARYGVTVSASLDTLWNNYALAADIDVLDNAHDVFTRLKAMNVRRVIATKGLSKYQIPVLKATDLLPLFDDILTPDKTGYLKTSPAYFNGYREKYPDALFIQLGDHHYDDVICAKRNGFYAIMRAPITELAPLDPFERPARLAEFAAQIPTFRADNPVRPDAVVVSLEEVPNVVKRIEEQAGK